MPILTSDSSEKMMLKNESINKANTQTCPPSNINMVTESTVLEL